MNKLANLRNLAGLYSSYIRRSERVKKLPNRIWIEPTPSCNLECGYCPHGMDEKFKKGLMEMDLFRSVIDELEGSLYDVNLFHRGESLIHPKLAEMVGYCRARGMRTRLHTNAGLLTEERAKNLIEAGLSYISFSVDGYTKSVYDKNRVGGDFDVTMENIVNFLRLKQKLGKGPFSIVQVMEIGEEENKLERRNNFVKRFDKLPLDRFVVRVPHNWAGDFEEFGHGVEGNSKIKFTPCTFLWYSMTIFFDGTAPPCPQDFFGKLTLGNVSDTSVTDVWNNDAMRDLRKRMKERDVTGIDPCEKCDILTRKTFMGVPVNYLTTFIKDNFLVG